MENTHPTIKAWSDQLLKETQKPTVFGKFFKRRLPITANTLADLNREYVTISINTFKKEYL